MLSQPPSIYILLSGVIAAVISSIFSIINNRWMSSVNNKLQLEREDKQHTRQLEREEQQRIWQEKSEQQKWYREKIYDCYRTSIHLSTKILQEYSEINVNSKSQNSVPLEKHTNLMKLRLEFASEFALIIAGYPGKDSEEFKKKIKEVHKYLNEGPWAVRPMITEIMEHDLRIKNINDK